VTLPLLLLSILSSVVLLCWGYFAVGWILAGTGLILVGVFWLVAIWRGWTWFSWVGLALITLAAGFGLLLDLPMVWMFAGLVGGMLAWDLSNFHWQLRFVEKEDLLPMERSHMVRMGLFLGIALALGVGSMVLRTRLTFEWVALLVLLGVWGLSRMVKWLRKPEK